MSTRSEREVSTDLRGSLRSYADEHGLDADDLEVLAVLVSELVDACITQALHDSRNQSAVVGIIRREIRIHGGLDRAFPYVARAMVRAEYDVTRRY